MKRRTLLFTVLILFSVCAMAQENIILVNPRVVTGQLIKVTPPVKNFRRDRTTIADIKVRDEDGVIGEKDEMEQSPELPKFFTRNPGSDPVLQKEYPNLSKTNAERLREVTSSFNGTGYTNVNPPDPTIAVGPNHVIQMVNGPSGSKFAIFTKSGTQLVPPTYLDNITGNGGLGDPIVLYDQLADRFLMTEFVNVNETGTQGMSIAVSQTNDPTGSWYVYFFSTGGVFPDYPKFSVWGDAYYAKTNDFNSTNNYIGSSVYAFDRAKMLAGNTSAGMQVFTTGMGYKDFSTIPILLQGSLAPVANTGGLFVYMNERSWTGSTADSIGIIEFKVDFITPSNSTLISRSSLVTADYTAMICGANRSQCISQPGSAVMLEALDQRVMNQPVYRNFGSYEGIVLTHAVDKGGNISGLRWYELIKTTGSWSIRQQSTFSPDNTHRFMPAICYDSKGDIGLAYNVSGTSVYPGIRYTGRKACDPLNTMPYAEISLADGSAANSNSRYGDYSQMVCDPDGLTFWFTGMYNSSSSWSTKIASFTLDTCTTSCTAPTSLTSSNITISSATIGWTAAGNALSYALDYKLHSSSTWTNLASSTTAVSMSITGLTAGTVYDWRVMTNCQGGTSTYTSAQFTTTANAACNQPTNLVSSAITTSSVTLSWSAVVGAVKYAIDYKKSSATTWTSASTGQTTLTKSLTSLVAGTSYDWRVKTICSTSAGSSLYSTAQFTTIPICPDQLESNNTLAAAKTIPVGTDVLAQIASSTDLDFYSFSNTATQNNIRLTLTNLPANYDMKLFSPSGTLLLTAATTGTANETINYNTSVIGVYKVEVYGFNKVFSNTKCYTLQALTGSQSFAPEIYSREMQVNGLSVYPLPANQNVTLTFNEPQNTDATIIIEDGLGKTVMSKIIPVIEGKNIYRLDVSKFASGVYFLKLATASGILAQKLIIANH
jgi:hypothetical protein